MLAHAATLQETDLEAVKPIGVRVWIEVEQWSNIPSTELYLPRREHRLSANNDRQGRVFAIGPDVKHIKVGQWAWYRRLDGRNAICGGRQFVIVPETYVQMTDSLPCGDLILIEPADGPEPSPVMVPARADVTDLVWGHVLAVGPESDTVDADDLIAFLPISGTDMTANGEPRKLLRLIEVVAKWVRDDRD